MADPVIIPQRFWMRGGTEANLEAADETPFARELYVVTDVPGAFKWGLSGESPWHLIPWATDPFFAVASGTDALTATFRPKPILVDGQQFRVRAAGANTGPITFQPNDMDALPVTKQGGTDLAAGDIAGDGHELLLRYRESPTRFELLNPVAGSGGGSSTAGGITVLGGAPDLIANLAVGFASTDVMPAGYEITGWELMVYPSGSLTLDIRKGSSIAVTPSSITPSGKPAVIAATNATGDVTGWTSTSFTQSNVLSVVITANSGVKQFWLLLKGTRT